MIPKNLKKTWKKDYYKLTSEERSKLCDFYIKYLQSYESSGSVGKKLNPPYFMTQEDVLAREEDVKMNIDAAREKERKDREESLKRENHKIEWESRRFLKLEEAERLRLENFQLKLELVERALKDANTKKNDIVSAQINFAKKIEERLKISLDEYAIDLITGTIARYPEIAYKVSEDLEKK